LGRSDFDGFVSAMAIVIAHMLKWDHQPGRRSQSWVRSIDEHRSRLSRALSSWPGYSDRIGEAMERAHRSARKLAARETGFSLNLFPEACPYTWADIQERDHPLNEAGGHEHG
jgi:hypothetical protein